MSPLVMALLSCFGSLITGYAARHFNILNHPQAANPPTTPPVAPVTPTVPASSPLANGVTVAPTTGSPPLLPANHPIMQAFAGRMSAILSQAVEAMLSQIQPPVPQPVQVVSPPPNPFLTQATNVAAVSQVAATAPAVVAAPQVVGTSQVVAAGS